MRMVKIAPSILAADMSSLGSEVKAVTQAGADWIHIDIMDGHFVPNLTIGPDVVQALRPYTTLPFDVHLMIAPVDPYIESFAKAGANILTIHPEAGPHLHRSLQLIKSYGLKAGVALNPATSIEIVLPILESIDLILVMTVNPGFGGQKFLPEPLKKVHTLRQLIDKHKLPILLEVDGGINSQTSLQAIEAGVDVLVAGTAIFSKSNKDYTVNIAALRNPTG